MIQYSRLRNREFVRTGATGFLATLMASGSAFGQDVVETAPAASAVQEITLEMMLREGGPILWAIGALGFFALVWVFYLFFTVSVRREAPAKLLKRAASQIKAGDLRGAFLMCEGRDELIARVLYAGLKMGDQERYIIQEAMESEGERGAASLRQRISYLNNIGAIAPLLGLLGTVWGMIGAFGAIALDNSQTKGLAMAYNVSQAMITTAAGLLVAIPALVFYYYFRGRVLVVISNVEAHASEFVELIVRHREK